MMQVSNCLKICFSADSKTLWVKWRKWICNWGDQNEKISMFSIKNWVLKHESLNWRTKSFVWISKMNYWSLNKAAWNVRLCKSKLDLPGYNSKTQNSFSIVRNLPLRGDWLSQNLPKGGIQKTKLKRGGIGKRCGMIY